MSSSNRETGAGPVRAADLDSRQAMLEMVGSAAVWWDLLNDPGALAWRIEKIIPDSAPTANSDKR
ncbi:MAG: hypothetical protein AAGA50_27640 [Pseudomonadota bacterium]